MNKSLYKNVDCSNFNLSYYLIENEDNTGYGVAVEKLYNSEIQESKSVYGISTNKDNVNHLLDKISDGEVTPVALYDIVTDYIE